MKIRSMLLATVGLAAMVSGSALAQEGGNRGLPDARSGLDAL